MWSPLRHALAALSLIAATAASAEEPVHLIVPYPPGSSPDVVARLVADGLHARTGQTIVVDNKSGAAGMLGTGAVAKAAPDGRTIGLSIAGPLAVNTLLFKTMTYDPATELAPVTVAVTQPSVLVVNPSVPAKDVAALLALLKADPGKFNYASMGAGSISHLGVAALAASSGTTIVHVPYKGSGAASAAVMSGEVQMGLLPAIAVMPLVKDGRLRALAIASAERSPALPDLPTLKESGIAGVQADAWMGFVVPAGTDAKVVSKLHDDIKAVLDDTALQQRLRSQYMDTVANTPAQFKQLLADDVARWKPVIEKNNISLD